MQHAFRALSARRPHPSRDPRWRTSIAAARGLGLHLESTSDWKEERKQFRGKLGVSARSESDAQRAAQCGFNWAFLPQWSVGEAAVLRAQRALPEIDVIALGGVTPASAARLAAGGGRGVAVLGGIFGEGSSPPTYVMPLLSTSRPSNRSSSTHRSITGPATSRDCKMCYFPDVCIMCI